MNKLTKFLLIGVIIAGFNSTSWTQSQALTNSETTDKDAIHLKNLLERIGERIQKYQDVMFSIAFTEVLQQQELKSDETSKNKSKEFVYESVVVSRTSPTSQQNSFPIITRTLKSVDGKPTEQKDLRSRSKCADTNPRSAYTDPLNFLLPKNQSKLIFSYAGESELEGRKVAVILISQPPPSEPVKIVQTGNCFRLSRPLQTQGRIWVDPNTYDVIQLQWQLAESFKGKRSPGIARHGIFPIFRPRIEIDYKKDETIFRFRHVTFQNPEQTLLLPSSLESTQIIEGWGIEGLQQTTNYTGYRRFLTSVEIKDLDEDKN